MNDRNARSRDELVQEMVKEHLKSLESRTQIEKIMSQLQDLVDQGKRHLLAWRQIYDIVHSEPELIDLAPQFFLMTCIAHIQAATLVIAKVTEIHSDSVNLTYLFNISVNEGCRYFPKNRKEVKKSVEDDMAALKDIDGILKKIKDERDKRIAHLDRDIINSGFGQSTLIEVDELDKVIESIDKILDKYLVFYYGHPRSNESRDWTEILGPAGLEELLYLVRKSLDDSTEALEDASDFVKNIRSWRQSKLWAQRILSGDTPEIRQTKVHGQNQEETP